MTIEEHLENMEQELGRIKRRNRWLLGAILLLFGGLVAAGSFKTWVTLVQAQVTGTAKEIRARKILIEDENGKMRAWLGVNNDGPALSLWDEKGTPRAWLTVGHYGPRLSLWDEKGKTRAKLDVSIDGPTLLMWDEKLNVRAKLVADPDGPSLELHDEKGRTRFAAGKTWIESQDGKTIEYPESSLILYGPDGKVIWSAIK